MFLNFPFFLVQVLLFIFCDFRLLVLSVIGVFFCFFVYFQGTRIQVARRIHSNYVLQVHKVTSGEVVHNFINDSWFLCHVATWTSHVATSFLIPSATSRRGPPTSRRQNHMLLSRRDVYFHVTKSISTRLYHVATCIFTSRREFVPASVTWRRRPTRRDVKFICLCHVATWTPTSRRGLNPLSVTSRRDPVRRDVTLF